MVDRIDPVKFVAAMPLGRNTRRAADAMLEKFGRWVTLDWLADRVYSDDPNGGPSGARNCIMIFIMRLRPRLAGSGLCIESKTRCGYRMVWADKGPAKDAP